MANRAFLVATHAHHPNEVFYCAEDIVAAASYLLPILWCSVFSPSDIYRFGLQEWTDELAEGESRPEPYPVLYAPLTTIRQRAHDRRERFHTTFPEMLDRSYGAWLTLLAGIDAPYLFVDTEELWGMETIPDTFDRYLTACVRAFETNDARNWRVLINQGSGLRFDRTMKRAVLTEKGINAPYDLHGYRWLRPVPWAD